MREYVGHYVKSSAEDLYAKIIEKTNRKDRFPLKMLVVRKDPKDPDGKAIDVCFERPEALKNWAEISKKEFDEVFLVVSEYLIHLKDASNTEIPEYNLTIESEEAIPNEYIANVKGKLEKLIEDCGGGIHAVKSLEAYSEGHPELKINYSYASCHGTDIWGWHKKDSWHVLG